MLGILYTVFTILVYAAIGIMSRTDTTGYVSGGRSKDKPSISTEGSTTGPPMHSVRDVVKRSPLHPGCVGGAPCLAVQETLVETLVAGLKHNRNPDPNPNLRPLAAHPIHSYPNPSPIPKSYPYPYPYP